MAKPVDEEQKLLRRGHAQIGWLKERFWERDLPKPWIFRDGRCIDSNEIIRGKHELDKDDRCIFCGWLKPEKP